MKNFVITLFIFALIFSACKTNTSTKLTAEQKALIGKEVKGLYSNAISNLKNMDMDEWSEPWSKDGLICVNSGVNPFATFSAFKDSVGHWFSLRESQQVEIIRLNATVLNNELVLITSACNWDIAFKNGEKMKVDVLATLLWEKEEDGWKIIHLHESWQ